MTFKEYELKFREKALNAGFSEENIQKCLHYAEKLIANRVPVIYNTTNFAAYVGYNKNYIKRVASFSKAFYRKFEIKKKDGSFREIKEPLPSLKEIQIWILENILNNLQVSRFAKAYISKRGIIDNTKFHKNKEILLCFDVKDFFSSISIKKIEELFLQMGYSAIISSLLSKICCNEDILPQGAPTSPCLSNIFMYNFDENVAKFCKTLDIRYTRYADDITFSFSKKMDTTVVKTFLESELKKLDLKLNPKKTKISLPSDRQLVTGIIVNNTTLRVPRENRKEIRQEIYYIKKHGLSSHLNLTKNLRANYLEHLLGKINFALYVDNKDKELISYKEYVQFLIIDKII